jgi:hypothetical protein
VLDGTIQSFNEARYPDGFMNGRLGHAPKLFLKKPDDPIGPPSGMPNPSALKKVFPGETVSGGYPRRVRDNSPDCCRRFGGNPFIGVQNKHPGLTALIDGKLFLRPESPPPGLQENLAAEIPRNPDGIIRTARVDDDNLLRKGDAPQAIRQIIRLVFRDDGYGKRKFSCHLMSIFFNIPKFLIKQRRAPSFYTIGYQAAPLSPAADFPAC